MQWSCELCKSHCKSTRQYTYFICVPFQEEIKKKKKKYNQLKHSEKVWKGKKEHRLQLRSGWQKSASQLAQALSMVLAQPSLGRPPDKYMCQLCTQAQRSPEQSATPGYRSNRETPLTNGINHRGTCRDFKGFQDSSFTLRTISLWDITPHRIAISKILTKTSFH